MGQQKHIQMIHAAFLKKLPGENAFGTGIGFLWMVVTDKGIMTAVHQKRITQCITAHFTDQNGISIAHVDKIQQKHDKKNPLSGGTVPHNR